MIQLHIACGICLAQFLGYEKYFGKFLLSNKLYYRCFTYITINLKEIIDYGTI